MAATAGPTHKGSENDAENKMISLETRVRLKLWLLQSKLPGVLALLSWLRSRAVPHRNDFGPFDPK
jgi:hypothetical protein